MTGRGEWLTPAGNERLRVAWDRGDAASAIGAAFGVSKHAIVGKAHRLGLDARPSPIIRTACDSPPEVPASTLPPLPSEMHAAPGVSGHSREAANETLGPGPSSTTAGVLPPEATLGSGTCSWLTSERPYRYCDEPVFGRLSYCECHAAQVYATKGWRQRQREAADEPVHLPIGE